MSDTHYNNSEDYDFGWVYRANGVSTVRRGPVATFAWRTLFVVMLLLIGLVVLGGLAELIFAPGFFKVWGAVNTVWGTVLIFLFKSQHGYVWHGRLRD